MSTLNPPTVSSQQSNLSFQRSTLTSPFLKFFLNAMWVEPYLEMLFGACLLLVPSNVFVLRTFMSLPLLESLGLYGDMNQNPVVLGVIALSQLKDLILFMVRFAGMLLFAFGMIHHLLLRACYKDIAFSDLNVLVEKVPLFQLTVMGLCVGDLMHIIMVWTYVLYSATSAIVRGPAGDVKQVENTGWLWSSLFLLVPSVISSAALVMRLIFLSRYGNVPVEKQESASTRAHAE